MIKLPEHAPYSASEREALELLLSGLTGEQRQWLGGYLAGDGSGGARALTILYGTESGNCEVLAELTARAAKQSGMTPRIRNMAETAPEDLAGMEDLLVIVSTWGEGDPPDAAEGFYQGIMNGGPSLDTMRFSVCALGDTSYEEFCETGKQLDRRLEELGARRLVDREDCDVDFEDAHTEWLGKVLAAFGSEAAAGEADIPMVTVAAAEYGKKNPFPAELLAKVLLNGKGTAKETWHLEFSLEGSGLVYEVGDSLAVVPRNASDVVDAVLAASGLNGEEEVTLKDGSALALREAFASRLDITALSRSVARNYRDLTGSSALAELLSDDNREAFKEYAWGRQIVDLLEDYPMDGKSAAELVSVLRPLPPRLYSIASSPAAHPGEVHLTVAGVRYDSHGKSRKGVASTCLADMVAAGESIPVYVQPNKRFRIPEEGATPIIMVGPGTGVAPYRAFVEERAARGATGRNWLIFGDQHYTYDFLYQLEWQEHLKSGALTRIDVAFSRDQPEKVYVQDRLREQAAEVFAWLEQGACFYVCGDATRMAGDVHEALLEIIEAEGGQSRKDAETYIEDMKINGRYLRDVY